MASNPTRDEIVRRIDPIVEFVKHGGVVGKYRSADGEWQSVHSIDREDNNPSAAINISPDPSKRGIYTDHAPTGDGARSFFDMLAGMTGSPFMTGREAYNFYGKQTGVLTGEGRGKSGEFKTPPTMADIEAYQKNLTPEIVQYMKDKRGLNENSLTKHMIGWDLKKERNAFPVFDETGALVNVRYHNSKKKPKTLNWPGCGGAKLWGLDRLTKAAPGITVVACEGEFDAMLVEQETGLLAVSSTNGVAAFKKEWVRHFHGFHVVILYDADKEGREGVPKILADFKPAVESGQIPSIKVVWLYDKIDKAHKDFTDWIVKDGGSGARLKELIAQTEPHTYLKPVSYIESSITLDSFEQVDQGKYAGKRVTVPIQVFGENTVAYHALTKIKVSHCLDLINSKCNGKKGCEGACGGEIEIPLGDRLMIAGVRATEGQLQNHLRAFVCDKDKRPALTYKDEDRLTIREVYGHQVVGAMAAERIELVEHPVYVIGGSLVEIGKYQATGRVLTSFRDQQPTMLIDQMERLEEDYQAFTVEKYRANLEKIRAMDPDEIAEDLAVHVTRIYERPDLHLGCLLILCSPLGFEFPGEGNIRGWLTGIVVGDTGTGKTTVSEGLFNFAKVGNRVSGMTASRTGITYGCEHDERRGWRIKAGALLKANRQALIVDEAQDIASEDLKTMAEGIDTGLVRIDKIQNKVFESKTRVLFGCNPVNPKWHAGQRTMDSFRYGCEAIKGIFPDMMIRRIDFVMFAASWDIEDKEKIYFPEKPDTAQQVEVEDLQALIFFAWNLKPEQIVIDTKVAHYIRQMAKHMSDKYGGADDLPIVYSEDFRKTMARLSVAYAALDLSTTEDFDQVNVEVRHVSYAYELLDRIYRARNCKLEKYAKAYRQTHGIAGIEKIIIDIDKILHNDGNEQHQNSGKRFHHIFYELLKCQDGSCVRKADLMDEFGVDSKTIQRNMQFFRDHHLIDVNIQKGYKPAPRFNQVFDYLERLDSKKYCFETYWREVFGEQGD
ncbi:MAG: toprim domain-containing protein [Candidatus Micrarchaeia archaeon]|jgi:hypothetical protein